MVLDKTGSGKSDEKALLAMMLVSLCFVAILFMTPSDLSVDMLTGHASGLQAEREMSAKSIRIDERVISVADAEGKVDVLVTFDEEEKTQAAGAFKSSGQEKSLRDEMASRLGSDKVRHMMSSSDTVSLQLTHDELDELKSDYSIKSISYDHPIRPFLDDSIPLTSTDDAWSLDVPDVDMKGNSTAVCVVDTGVDYTHPAFGGCTHQEFLDGDCRVIDGYDVADDDDDPMDYNGHGTHVAGIVASDGDYVGMAPSVDIIAIKVFTDDDGGTEADIIAGIDRCVDMTENYDISAMTLSLGLETEDDPVLREDYCDVEFDELAASIDAAVDAGITVATATGNSGNHSMIGVPACVENAARVTSTTKTDVISDFSDRNALVNLTAPGEDIASTMPDSSYGIMSGTSMAAPHVAGLVSLLTQYLEFEGRSLHPKQLENALYRTGVFIDDTGASGENFSRIDALATLRYLDEKPPIASITTDQNDSFHYSEGITIDWSSEDVFGSASGNFTVNYPDGSELFFSDNTSGTETLSSDNLSQEGRYSAEMYALDNNSNLAYTNLTFNVTGLPLANITLLLNGSEGDMAINDSGVVNITAYHQDGELDLELFIDDSKEAIGDPNLSILKEFNTTDEHEIRVRHNETENVSYSEKISFLQVYNTTPQIIRWSPTQEDINLSRNKTMTFNQSSEDEQGLPLSFQWLLNDELMADDAWFELDGADPELGIHELLFIANNTIRTNNISWQVNITPLPIGINISSPANTSYDTHEIPLEFSLGENPDIDRCWYELNESNMTFVEACDDTELQVPEDGHYTLIMYANNTLDENGSSEAGFTVDTIDPLLDLYGVPTGDVISQSQEFSVDASPGPSGLEGVFFDKGDGWVEVDQGVPFMPFSSLETTQDVSILFKAEDGAGNTNISKSKEYTVDLTPPEMDILTELPDKTNQTFNLTVALDEELAELSNFSYMINDRDWMFPDITLNGSRSNVTVNLNLSPGSNDVVLKSNDTLGNTGNISFDLEARGVLNISSQDTELESMLDGFEVSFEDEDGKDILGQEHTDNLTGMMMKLSTSDTEVNISGIDPTKMRWENKSLKAYLEDADIGESLGHHADPPEALLRIDDTKGFFRDGSFEVAEVVFAKDPSMIDYVYKFPSPENTSTFTRISSCPQDPDVGDIPCYTGGDNLSVMLDSFSAVTAGQDQKPPEVHPHFSDFPDWKFIPKIIVSNDVLDTSDLHLSIDGEAVGDGESLESFNTTHRLATFEEIEDVHGTSLNLSFEAMDSVGNLNDSVWKNVTINDTEAPEISLDIPDGYETNSSSITIGVELNKPGVVKFVDDDAQTGDCFDGKREGTCTVSLNKGENYIDIEAENLAGVEDASFLSVIRIDEEDDSEAIGDLPEDEEEEDDEDDEEEDENDDADDERTHDNETEDASMTRQSEEMEGNVTAEEGNGQDVQEVFSGMIMAFGPYKEAILLSSSLVLFFVIMLLLLRHKKRKKGDGALSSLSSTKMEPLMDDYAPEDRKVWEKRQKKDMKTRSGAGSTEKASGKSINADKKRKSPQSSRNKRKPASRKRKG